MASVSGLPKTKYNGASDTSGTVGSLINEAGEHLPNVWKNKQLFRTVFFSLLCSVTFFCKFYSHAYVNTKKTLTHGNKPRAF